MSDQLRCPRCETTFRTMDGNVAFSLYERLKSRLSMVNSFGCYTPKRGQAETGDHSAWPLHFWRGPGTYPLVAEFKPGGTMPSFQEFCLVYGLTIVEQ